MRAHCFVEVPLSAQLSLPARRIPLAVKLAFTGFTAVLVPFYWITYGPTNFLYYCDIALFFTLAAVWTEIPLLAGMPAVGASNEAKGEGAAELLAAGVL